MLPTFPNPEFVTPTGFPSCRGRCRPTPRSRTRAAAEVGGADVAAAHIGVTVISAAQVGFSGIAAADVVVAGVSRVEILAAVIADAGVQIRQTRRCQGSNSAAMALLRLSYPSGTTEAEAGIKRCGETIRRTDRSSAKKQAAKGD
ncbi:hypothetical protein [Mycobacterium camsae]|uniref:hypothetical protein n=1 Tax=Mycobacterium gordonae TaxID=1778 RepID=UPI00197FE65B|nr:hypothetical protein [Mycobacterium gordonae]